MPRTHGFEARSGELAGRSAHDLPYRLNRVVQRSRQQLPSRGQAGSDSRMVLTGRVTH